MATDNSVFDLVTKLCENLVKQRGRPSTALVRRLRCLAFEILLFGSRPFRIETLWLDGSLDAQCQLMAWQFELRHRYRCEKVSEDIDACAEKLFDTTSCIWENVNNTLYFLLLLKQVPPKKSKDRERNDLGLYDLNGSFFRMFESHDFQLNEEEECCTQNCSTLSFDLPHDDFDADWDPWVGDGYSSETPYLYEETVGSENIWDVVSRIKYTSRRTWEAYGDPTPPMELPFCGDSTAEIFSMVLARGRLLGQRMLPGLLQPPAETVPHTKFINDLKSLVVGNETTTFRYREDEGFELSEQVLYEGLGRCALEGFCAMPLNCGNCYRELTALVGKVRSGQQRGGHIIREFCMAIERYLVFYRLVALNFSETDGIFSYHLHVRKLFEHLRMIAAMCRVGPYRNANSKMPDGFELLNYLDESFHFEVNTQVRLVLYALLRPCLRIYFTRFLQPWLLDGVVVDPHNEFFIRTTHKYLSCRDRTYWTRTFILSDSMVPKFLRNFKDLIFRTGKAVNMLKLCAPNSSVSKCIRNTRPNLFRCCAGPEELTKLETAVMSYQLDVMALGGSPFSLREHLALREAKKLVFQKMAVAKRAATMKRIMAEKVQKAMKERLAKQDRIDEVRAEYLKVLQDSKAAKIEALKKQLDDEQEMYKLHTVQENLIREEAEKMISFYENLTKAAGELSVCVSMHYETARSIRLDLDPMLRRSPIPSSEMDSDVLNANYTESPFELGNESCDNDTAAEINSNALDSRFNTDSDPSRSDLLQQYEESTQDAKRFKERYLQDELGMSDTLSSETHLTPTEGLETLTEEQTANLPVNETFAMARRNKLRVMSSEFDILTISDSFELSRVSSMPSNATYGKDKQIDNDNYVNKNMSNSNTIEEESSEQPTNEHNNNAPSSSEFDSAIGTKETRTLTTLFTSDLLEQDEATTLDSLEKEGNELQVSLLLSTDSTTSFNSPPSMFSSCMKTPKFELTRTDSMFEIDDSEFFTALSENENDVPLIDEEDFSFDDTYSMPTEEPKSAETERMKCLCCFLDLSISGPLNVQYELASKDLLRHFVVDLKCLKQFECLRSYYFMLDGEYNRNMTEGIFQKMYKAGDAKDLLNVRTMKSIIYSALDACATSRTDTQRVSFRIKPLPRVLDLSDINILECISLSYEVKWPLNVLLPKDVLAKYDDIFKFLLKVNRVSWVLKQMFMDLKMLHKNRGLYLTTSPQYQKVHLCRHVMTHFLQTLQNYIIGEVLENSWLEFHEVLETVESLEELNCAHSDYLKKIYFLCLLNEKSAPVRKVVMDMLLVILKFYDYLRSRRWVFDEDEYVHPNYVKLMEVFCNFMQLGKYFYKLGRKVAHAAYQPQFAHLMDILDMNYYYTYLNEKVY